MKQLILIPVLLFGSLVHAQCYVPAQDVFTRVLSIHPSMQMGKFAQEGAMARVEGAEWGYYPTPSVELNSQDSDRTQTVLRLEQPLYTFGKLSSQVDLAKSHYQESLHETDDMAYQLLENVISITDNYVQAVAGLNEIAQGLTELNNLADMLGRRIEAGVSAQSDSDLLNSRLASLKTEQITTENRKAVAQAQLELLLEDKLNCQLNAAAIALPQQSLDDSLALALASHPHMRLIEQQIESAKAEYDAVSASAYPSLVLRGEYLDGSINQRNAPNDTIVYAALTASPGAGLSIMSNLKAAEMNIAKARAQKKSVAKRISEQLINDVNQQLVLSQKIDSLKHTIETTEYVLESYKRLFMAGKRQWLDLVNMQKELTQYRLDMAYSQAQLELLSYKLALKRGQFNLTTGMLYQQARIAKLALSILCLFRYYVNGLSCQKFSLTQCTAQMRPQTAQPAKICLGC